MGSISVGLRFRRCFRFHGWQCIAKTETISRSVEERWQRWLQDSTPSQNLHGAEACCQSVQRHAECPHECRLVEATNDELTTKLQCSEEALQESRSSIKQSARWGVEQHATRLLSRMPRRTPGRRHCSMPVQKSRHAAVGRTLSVQVRCDVADYSICCRCR